MRRSVLKHVLKIFIITTLFIAIFLIASNLIFINKISPNTYFSSLNISGRNEAQLRNIVINSINNYEKQKQRIVVGGKSFEFTFKELGVSFYPQKTADYLVQDAKINSLLNIGKVGTALVKSKKYLPIYRVDSAKLTSLLNDKFSSLESGPINATISMNSNQPNIVSSKAGVVIDRGLLVSELKSNIDNLNNNVIMVQHAQVLPFIKSGQVQQAYNKVLLLNDQNITLKYELESWDLSGEQLLELLRFELQGFNGESIVLVENPNNPISLNNIYYKSNNLPILEVVLREDQVDQVIDEMAVVIDKVTVDATLEFDGNKVSRFTPAQDGRLLNRREVKAIIRNIISVDNLAYETKVNINLPVIETKAQIANEEITSLGIKELIASGVSYFQGSIPNRAFNIGLGSEFINGVIIPPGEVFSFNELVGPVSSEQGFKQAYVINKGRTVLDDGGGICQVSTTVFRAALNAGLPIVARTAHAYRVSYYEQRGFEPGYDATIWSPTVDLKFKNDTAYHILVQAVVDRVNSKLQVDIYGTSDGRKVKLTKPILTNRRPAPDPLYQDDPTLPVGTTKQVDWAADGLKSVFDRMVSRDGEVIIDESFTSNFRPWQAVYLVGTGG